MKQEIVVKIGIKKFWQHVALGVFSIVGAFYGAYIVFAQSIEARTEEAFHSYITNLQNGMTIQVLTNNLMRIAEATREITSNAPLAKLNRAAHVESGEILIDNSCGINPFRAARIDGKPHRVVTITNIFNKPYDMPPKIITGLISFDMGPNVHGLDNSVVATRTNFIFSITTWHDDFNVTMLKYGWVAISDTGSY